MGPLKVYREDLQIAKALLQRDEIITRNYYYIGSYPLFKSIYDNYCTDSINLKEFMDEIYLLIMTPSKKTGRCKLENYRGDSTLRTWIKSVSLYYCYAKYGEKQKMQIVDLSVLSEDDTDEVGNDRLLDVSCSCTINFSQLDKMDIETVLNLMSNDRYREIIRLHYIDGLSHTETAALLGITMANYYNKRKLAYAQFEKISKKEGLL